MTAEEIRSSVIDCLRYAHFMNEAFIHGEEYIKKNYVWIEWEFERKIKRMNESEWEMHIKAYIKALNELYIGSDNRSKEGDRNENRD